MDEVLVVYDTMTGNVRRFVNKLPKQFKCYHISEYDGTSPFVLVTYTTNFGEVPETTTKFLKQHGDKMLGVSSSGNKNWGRFFGIAADKISTMYKVPLISKFELQGTEQDIKNFIEGVDKKCQQSVSRRNG